LYYRFNRPRLGGDKPIDVEELWLFSFLWDLEGTSQENGQTKGKEKRDPKRKRKAEGEERSTELLGEKDER